MPLLPSDARTSMHRQSWPPSGLWPSSPSRIPPALDEDKDGLSTDDEDIDISRRPENPLKYFLTPATPMEEELEFQFDFDAGIEDSNSPRQIVRSVSPSTLDGLRRYKARSKEAGCAILDDDDEDEDDDGEEYIRFTPQKPLPFGLDDYFDCPRRSSPNRRGSDSLLSPSSPSFHVGSPRGRLAKRFAPPPPSRRVRPHARTLQRRHSWREPSPDVWSIDEEPEKETRSEMGLSTEDLDDGTEKKTQPIDIPAAKPRKKKVRFVLPVTEY
ncbi:hypothetical protein F5B22DRAFT_187622 [Xylaria bambusicola]|uniref:uncharacterized protein n=1 Tax=Xylaria bambusicola TaxID=326684 RepID=UPI0020076267|nr:uncharacterized protein F5B22DRAFT_187622 [Xylaria bambusicola]KAI0515384.1 hypothetical protein F5B22DRAFT_187622 [Xylaria bambusicola]